VPFDGLLLGPDRQRRHPPTLQRQHSPLHNHPPIRQL
jgi:hypothetical protein